jgi:DNA-binding transcriptional LysR family regulator
MNDFDWSDLDVRLLQLLVAVVEAGSITGAAQALGVTQSAVSHQLDKLRAITGDALFVKSGRGIVATARAGELSVQARELLRQLQGFAQSDAFDPARWQATVTIAANDFQRDVLLPGLARALRAQAPHVALRIIPSDVPSLEMLRDGVCDIAISPRPPEGSDIVQKRLFEDRYRVYYDASARAAPASLADYLAADHITVVYAPRRTLHLDRTLEAQGVRRRFAVMVGFLRDFAHVDVPVPCPSLPMYLIWHRRHQQDAAQRWLREQIDTLVPTVMGC